MSPPPTLGTVLDVLDLGQDRRLVITEGPDGLAAVPAAPDADGGWRRARPGDGAAEALLHLLAGVRGSVPHGSFTVRSWTERAAVGERPIAAVDQTNESVIVGDAAVVKWATHLQDGPHPAPVRISTLRDNGFRGMPTPWGLITWQPPTGAQTLVATIDEYVPGAVDGWTWAVDLMTEAARGPDARPAQVITATTAVGHVVAELHAALAGTATVADDAAASHWRDAAFATLASAASLGTSALLRERRNEIDVILDQLGALAGTRVIEGHGDLHVGQVLYGDGRFVVTDFDGNPVLTAAERVRPIPAALDVAGMAQSLAHVMIVAGKHSALDARAAAEVDRMARQAFLRAYTSRLTELGHADFYDPVPLRAFRLQQVLREIIYAATHLPRWMYVPDAALPALLDERNVP
ncbi:MAG: glucosamine kinase [Mycobacterium sp.]